MAPDYAAMAESMQFEAEALVDGLREPGGAADCHHGAPGGAGRALATICDGTRLILIRRGHAYILCSYNDGDSGQPPGVCIVALGSRTSALTRPRTLWAPPENYSTAPHGYIIGV